MTRLILSTSNVMNGGPSIIRKPANEKSNVELIAALRASFQCAQEAAADKLGTDLGRKKVDGDHLPMSTWTTREEESLFIPSIEWSEAGLCEEPSQYDVTLKLFYLPGVPPARRAAQTREAIELVLRQLRIPSVGLLIVSFPGVTYDSETRCNSPHGGSCQPVSANVELDTLDTMVDAWRTLEVLYSQGIIDRLGVCEFGTQQLEDFLRRTKVRPAVNQVNLRDCCAVPRSLILLAKKEGVELLTHSDCTNILPQGTLRELLGDGPQGAGVLSDGHSTDALNGEVEPQWVVKYTAVVKDRGVVENKGYFALAELGETTNGISA